MGWYAKPSYAYAVYSDEWYNNIKEFWSVTKALGYTLQATCGMIGNAQYEGGMNPWRWQSDEVDYTMGYGLFQYTPASGYINGYGVGKSGYGPNLSITEVTSGALASDGKAQILAIADSGKYSGGETRSATIEEYFSDCRSYQTLDEFKTMTNIYNATVCWLGYFEAPGEITAAKVKERSDLAKVAYEYLSDTPEPTEVDFLILAKGAKKRRWRL